MKLFFASFTTLMSLSATRARAEDHHDYYSVMNYDFATAILSSNVGWSTTDGSSLVDGNVKGGGASYPGTGCQADIKDLGYVTIDLGETMELDGVRVYMAESGAYCNMDVEVWDVNEPEPSFAALPGQTTTTASPTGAPTKAPTSSPTAGPTATQIASSSGTSTRKCVQCGDYSAHIPCEGAELFFDKVTDCPPDGPQDFCQTDVITRHSGEQWVFKRCAGYYNARKEWFDQTSDKPVCLNYDPVGAPPDLECHFVCIGDGCNLNLVPDSRTFWRPTRRMQQLSLTRASDGVESGKGIDFFVGPQKQARYIRVWADRMSAPVGILEVQPLTKGLKSTVIAADTPSNTFSTVNLTLPQSGLSTGDPHFLTFGGRKYDFHGGCDLVLVTNPSFADSQGLQINVRTSISNWWSSIERAVIKVGNATLEVKGGTNNGEYWINHQKGVGLKENKEVALNDIMKVKMRRSSAKLVVYRIDLNHGTMVTFQTYKTFVSVKVTVNKDVRMHGSQGLMGLFPTGEMMARDNVTNMEDDPNAFGKEWQVREDEPMLFHTTEGSVQHPAVCEMPLVDAASSRRTRRRLGEVMVTEEEAEVACQKVEEIHRDMCIYDVLATNDKGMAGAY